jgi:hypothetical protein
MRKRALENRGWGRKRRARRDWRDRRERRDWRKRRERRKRSGIKGEERNKGRCKVLKKEGAETEKALKSQKPALRKAPMKPKGKLRLKLL